MTENVKRFPDTPRGIYYYRSLWGCLKRANMDRELADDGGPDAEFGSNLHEWLASYHGGVTTEAPTLSTERDSQYTCSEAEMAEWYSATFPPDAFGEVLMMEQMLEGEITVVDPHTRPSRWIHPVRGRIDMVVDLDPTAAALLYNILGVTITPGLYLVDHKTKKSHTKILIPSLLADPQFTMYHELLRQNYGEMEIKGTLVNLLFRYTRPRPDMFKAFTIPPPGDAERRVLQTVVHGGARRLWELGPDHKSPVDCYTWNRECPLLGFECDRSNEPHA